MVAAVAIAALLPLTACGSGDGNAATAPTGRAVPGPAARDATPAPFPFPADIKIVFESPKPAEATRAAIIGGFEYVYQGYYYGLHTRGKDRRFFKRMQHEALFGFSKTFDASVRRGDTVTGTLRFFNTQVSAISGNRGAAVASCVDETQWRMKNLRTKKIIPTLPENRRHYQVTAAMRRGDDGVWRMFDFTTYYLPDSRAKECQQ
jgi:hypothetical protein